MTSPSITGRAELYAQFIGKPLISADMPDVVRARPKVQEAMAREADTLLLVKTHSILGRVFDVPLINLGVSVGACLPRAEPARCGGVDGVVSQQDDRRLDHIRWPRP